MKTLFLLITLTQNGAGDINASFVNTETLEQCQQKMSMVESVFVDAKIPLLESRCIKSNLQFSKFGHASNASQIRYFYLISVNDKIFHISAMPNWRSCMRQRKQSVSGRVYCSSSVQFIL